MASRDREHAGATRFAELTSILAVAFLRLTKKRRRSAASAAHDGSNLLEVSAEESPHDDLRRTL